MATEEADIAEATRQDKPAKNLVRTIGLGIGLFLLVIAAQLVTSIMGCMVMPGLMPGCSQHLAGDSAEEEAGGKKQAKGKATKPKAPPVYLALDPPLVVSFNEQNTMRFLQVTVEVMARDEESINAAKLHMPVIRNNLLNALSGRGLADLTSREGKESLRKECLAEIQRVLKANATKDSKASVEDLYFTSFVVQ